MNDERHRTPPLVVLPGMDGTGELLRAFAERVAQRRAVEVVAYPRDAALGYDELTRLARSRAPHRSYFVLGESFSGPIAVELAARDPNVLGVILVSSFVHAPLPRWLGWPARLIDIRRLPTALIEGVLLGSDRTPGVRERLAALLPTISPAAMRARALSALRVDRREALRLLTCPVLVVAATKDLLLGTRSLRLIRSVRPDVELELLSGPHMLLETRPFEVATAVERFCSRPARTGLARSA